jgi:hypothetical protein
MSETTQREVIRNRADRSADPRGAQMRSAGIGRTADDSATDTGAEPTAGRAAPAREDSFAPLYEGTGTRANRDSRDVGQFEIPERVRRAGWDGQWMARTIYGEPIPGSQTLAIRRAGWAPAKAKDFPEFVPDDANPDENVVLDGQQLFIRPLNLTHRAQTEDYRTAVAQQESRMQATRDGRSLDPDAEGLADMSRVVRTVPITLEVEGETGSMAPRR